MEDSRRCLIWHRMCVFLIGLLTGFVEPQFTNVRMGLAAHLEGVINGIFFLWGRRRSAVPTIRRNRTPITVGPLGLDEVSSKCR